jgi:integrase
MALTDFLKKRHQKWYVRVQIPKHLWSRAGGKREYVKALGTGDLMEANRLKHVWIAEFRRRIDDLERKGSDREATKLRETILTLRATLARYKDHRHSKDEDERAQAEAAIEAVLDDTREELGDEVAERAMDAALGRATFMREVYLDWLDETKPKPKQRDNHSVVIRDFMAWAGAGITIEEVNRKMAGAYVTHLKASGRASKTVERYRSSLSTLWAWLAEKGLVAEDYNPWRAHKSIKPKVENGRKLLSHEQLERILAGSYDTETYRQVIADLPRLALVTGCRLEELCALRRVNAVKRSDGYWFVIEKGKTDAAVREIPVHRSVQHVIERRSRGKGEFLFQEITPGAYGRRSHHVSKAYGRYRRQVGVAGRGEDFQALRRVFTEMMEGVGVPVSTIQLLIGHSRKKTMGVTAIYTQGQRVNLRDAINKLRYSRAVMKLIEQPPQQKELTSQKASPRSAA